MKYFVIGRTERHLAGGTQIRSVESFTVTADSDAQAMQSVRESHPDLFGVSLTHCDNHPPGRPLQLGELLSAFEREIARQFADAASA